VTNRKLDSTFTANYTLTGPGPSTGIERCTQDAYLAYFEGPILKVQPETWNNRQTAMALPYALAGILLNDATFKTEGKRYFTEFIRFGLYPDGMSNDFTKSGESSFTVPNMAIVYGLTTYGTLAQIADVYARSGDTSLYDYTTAVGNCGTAGGSKNLLLFATDEAKYVDHTFLRHGTNKATNATNPNWLIDTNSEVGPNNTVVDHALAITWSRISTPYSVYTGRSC
jgi:hypothetical protein